MDEICHKELARIVLIENSIPLVSEDLEKLVDSTIEPDNINKKLIAESLVNVLTVPVEWLVDHTIRAKELANDCIKKANEAYKEKDPSWLRLTGWAFHYIADWGTPHHSPTSKSNPVITSAGIGAIIGGIVGAISKSGKGKGEIKKGITQGALAGAGVGGGIGTINLAIKHSKFEALCDERWNIHVDFIHNHFKLKKVDSPIHLELDQALQVFDKRMDQLRSYSNNLPANWIKISDELQFGEYMVQIALVMDYAYQIIIKC